MRKIKFWVKTGYYGANYETTIEVDDDTTEDELDEQAEMFLFDNISYGWQEVDE